MSDFEVIHISRDYLHVALCTETWVQKLGLQVVKVLLGNPETDFQELYHMCKSIEGSC